MSTKEVETFIGPCSKFISGQGWVTEIPVEQIEAKGYIKVDQAAQLEIARLREENAKLHNEQLNAKIDSIRRRK